ncbi:MAG: ComEC/Rec2 family competence protein [Corynebacterium sp.]|nr:ComEC/Rec2 family competence protein [Corynebacterium sp.]
MSDLRMVLPAGSLWLFMLAWVYVDTRTLLMFSLVLAAGGILLAWRLQGIRWLLLVTIALSILGAAHLTWQQEQIHVFEQQSEINAQREENLFAAASAEKAARSTHQFAATISAGALAIQSGWYFRVQPAGMRGEIPCFVGADGITDPEDFASGAQVVLRGQIISRVGFPGLQMYATSVDLLQEPTSLAAFSNAVQDEFRTRVFAIMEAPAAGLLPAMVLGDTSGQSPTEKQWYIDTGLAHLSAVSGGNLSIIIAMLVAIGTWFGWSPRVQSCCALAGIAVFIVVVGTEPSVWRAGVMGAVTLSALLGYRRTYCIQALAVSIFILLLWQPELAFSFGFALSVAATAGIVVGFPALYKGLCFSWMPDVVAKALAVAIAADIVTIPLVAAMAGKIPVFGVITNVLAAPCVGVITIGGIFAVIMLPLPWISELIIWVLQPATWWIATLGRVGASHKHATFETGSTLLALAWVTILGAWCFWLWSARKGWVVAAGWFILFIGTALGWTTQPNQHWADIATLPQLEVSDTASIPPEIPTGVVIVVLEEGKPHDRPVFHPDGNLVWYPNRDGGIEVNELGQQRAVSGYF